MARVKFEKNSVYWRMFAEFYSLCQDYWEPEGTDEWWVELSAKASKFAKDYENSAFSRGLAMALVMEPEEKVRKEKNIC